jgi:hypothetical protein
MAPNGPLKVPRVGPVFPRLRHGGKKTVLAGALVLTMLFMWGRVFLGHRPAAAGAAAQTPSAETAVRRLPGKMQPVELPQIPGRHDTLPRDFFTMKDPASFGRNPARRSTGTDTEVPVVSTQNVTEVIQRVARTMKLEAVSWNESPRIFINDQLLAVGDRFLVKSGTQSFEFEVLQIYADSVLVRCDEVQLTLKLAQFLEVAH